MTKDAFIFQGKKQYLMKWKGYPLEESTWEPLEHLDGCIELIHAYDKLKKQETPSGTFKPVKARKRQEGQGAPGSSSGSGGLVTAVT